MNNEKKISLKEYLNIFDSEWKKIENEKDKMYKIWDKYKNTEEVKEIGRKHVDFINEIFLSKDDSDKAEETKTKETNTEKIYYPILREVCGKNILGDFRYVKIQIPSFKGKLTIHDMILHIRKLKREKNENFNKLDIKLIFWLMYSIMSSVMPKREKAKTAEQEKMEENKKNICLYAACMGIQIEEFLDVLNVIQYLLNNTLNLEVCKSSRTKFLEKLYSDIIENTFDTQENEQEQENVFKKYIEARHTLIYIKTLEEKQIMEHFIKIVHQYNEMADKKYQIYQCTIDGLVNLQTRMVKEEAEQYTLKDATKSISEELDKNPNRNEIYIFRTMEDGMKDTNTISRIKILAEKIRDTHANVFLIFLAKDIYIDSTLEKDFYIDMNFYYPKIWQIKEVLNAFFESKNIYIDQPFLLDDIAYNCKSLTTVEIRNALELAYVSLNRKFKGNENKYLQFIQDAKKQSLRKSGLLELIEEKSNVKDIGGLSELTEWLEKKSTIINNISSAKREHVDVPKGILLVGMPGCGKSLCAKYTASLFNVPLFRLDVGSLLDKYVGGSEHNFRDALLLAEEASPCVLWIDEMEKAFPNDSDGKNQSEVSSKMLGKFLTWMQEKKTLTFVIATVNKAKNIPVELTRHGRFDERFFVDFPNAKERAEIITVHLEKKGITFTDINYIVKNTEGYSGAELEHIVGEVLEQRFMNQHQKKESAVTKAMFAKAIKDTIPISKTNKEAIKEIKDYCKQNNIRSANKK